MKSITRLSLTLIMFSLFSISYLVTSVSAQGFAGGAPGSAAAGNTTSSGGISGWIEGGLNALGFGTGSGGNDCMNHPAGSAARTSCEKGK